MSAVRGVRGATTVEANDREAILAATRELLEHLVRLDRIEPADVASVQFTVTPDLDAEFPAFAAREIGWTEVPLICGREIPVPGALGRCIRVLIHWNTDLEQSEVRHAFLHGARSLRPAWAIDLPGDPVGSPRTPGAQAEDRGTRPSVAARPGAHARGSRGRALPDRGIDEPKEMA